MNRTPNFSAYQNSNFNNIYRNRLNNSQKFSSVPQQSPYNKGDFTSKNKQDSSCYTTEAKYINAPINSETYSNNKKKGIDSKPNYKDTFSSCSEQPILEFHGIKLYSDDLLILLLLYFLYKEKVNDNLLYIALFALLFL